MTELSIKNRIARLKANGKDNNNVIRKLQRKLKRVISR